MLYPSPAVTISLQFVLSVLYLYPTTSLVVSVPPVAFTVIAVSAVFTVSIVVGAVGASVSTFTVQLADSFPSCVVAVIIAVPAFIAVINPLFTVTTLESLLLQVTALLGEFPRYYCCYYCFCISYF